MSAIGDAVLTHAPNEILLFGRQRKLAPSHPLDIEHRARRTTRLPVRRISVRSDVGRRRRHGRMALRGGAHCHGDALPGA